MILLLVFMDKKNCYDYLKSFADVFGEDKMQNIKNKIEKLNDIKEKDNIKNEIIKEINLDAEKKLKEDLISVEKQNKLIEQIKAKMNQEYIKKGETKTLTRSFDKAIGSVFGGDLWNKDSIIYRKKTEIAKNIAEFTSDLMDTDKEAYKLMNYMLKTQRLKRAVGNFADPSVRFLDNNIRRELKELNTDGGRVGITGDNVAKEFASIYQKHITPLLDNLEIKKLQGYAGKQNHSVDALREVKYDKWSDEILDKFNLDIGKTFGEHATKEDAKKYLREIYSKIVYDTPYYTSSLKEKHRELFFKNVEDEINYNDAYNGGENIVQQMIGGISKLSDEKILRQHLGTNPIQTIKDILKHFREQDPDLDLKWNIENNQIVVKDWTGMSAGKYINLALSPGMAFQSNKKIALIFRAERHMVNNAVLPNVLVSYVSDIWTAPYHAMLRGEVGVINGIGETLKRTGTVMHGLYQGMTAQTRIGESGRDEIAKMVTAMGHADARMSLETNRYLSETNIGPYVKSKSKIKNFGSKAATMINAQSAMLFQSVQAMENMQSLKTWEAISSHIALDVDKSFNELSDTRKFWYNQYNIGEKEWSVIKKLTFDYDKAIGSKIAEDKKLIYGKSVMPDLALHLSDNDVKHLARGDILAEGKLTQRSYDEARQELCDKFHLLFKHSVDFALNRDNTWATLLFNGSSKAGTVSGEMLRNMGQLMKYSASITNNIVNTTINHPIFDSLDKTKLFAMGSILGSAFAYGSFAIRDTIKGKTPQDPTRLDTWIKAFEYTGMATIYGEYALKLFGKSSKSDYIEQQNWYKRIAGITQGPAGSKAIGSAINILSKQHLKDNNGNFDPHSDFGSADALKELQSWAPNFHPLQPFFSSLLSLNFLLSPIEKNKLINSTKKRGQSYWIPH